MKRSTQATRDRERRDPNKGLRKSGPLHHARCGREGDAPTQAEIVGGVVMSKRRETRDKTNTDINIREIAKWSTAPLRRSDTCRSYSNPRRRAHSRPSPWSFLPVEKSARVVPVDAWPALGPHPGNPGRRCRPRCRRRPVHSNEEARGVSDTTSVVSLDGTASPPAGSVPWISWQSTPAVMALLLGMAAIVASPHNLLPPLALGSWPGHLHWRIR